LGQRGPKIQDFLLKTNKVIIHFQAKLA